ncbi:MAG: hypothetical protein IH865_07950 [Chloroflexi bacterium]|nr:hypothetical protein [Chloroflexota bacterium]
MRYPPEVGSTNRRRLVFFGLPIVLLALGLAIAIALAPTPKGGFDVPVAEAARPNVRILGLKYHDFGFGSPVTVNLDRDTSKAHFRPGPDSNHGPVVLNDGDTVFVEVDSGEDKIGTSTRLALVGKNLIMIHTSCSKPLEVGFLYGPDNDETADNPSEFGGAGFQSGFEVIEIVLGSGTGGDCIAATPTNTPTETPTPTDTPTPTFTLTPTITTTQTPVPTGLGWMTSGGSILASAGRVTHGFTLHCHPSDQPNNLQVNWAGNSFHLEELELAICADDPSINETPPTADFDSYTGRGTGRLNGVSGATALWFFTDDGQPGRTDFMAIAITDVEGNVVLDAFGNLTGGNHQAHGPQGPPRDTDADGCNDVAELGAEPAQGGQRDPLNPWDFYDTNGDGVIDLAYDIFGVILAYENYDVIYDRGPSAGPNAWNMTAPDGVIDLTNDILGVIQQYQHNCQ